MFRPIVGGTIASVTATNPTFELLNPTGSLALTVVDSTAANVGDVQFNFATTSTISGVGTFSGFRLNTTLSGESGQTLTWGGGDADVRSAAGFRGSDQGLVLTLVSVPKPALAFPGALAFGSGGLIALGRRRMMRPAR